MPIDRNISFRTHLLGSIDDFVVSCDMDPIVRVRFLVELVVALAQYREEGRELSPEVYICEDIEKTLRLLPGHCSLHVGDTEISESSVAEVLKRCAPLAIDGWCIYIGKRGSRLLYGVFRDQLNPLSIPISEALLSLGSDRTKVVRIHQSAPNCVELANYKGDKHTVFLSHKPDTEPSPIAFIEELVAVICGKVVSGIRESTETFLRRTLTDALAASHGALIVVCDGSSTPRFLRDGSILERPIDFQSLTDAAVKDQAGAKQTLLSEASLIKGMLGCDGIVVFDRAARLLAYNCFIKPSKAAVGTKTGGARKRAFAALCERVGDGVYAAFIRSQDGWSQLAKS